MHLTALRAAGDAEGVGRTHPSPSRPHYLARKGPVGGTYVRVGSMNRLADAELIQELGRFARGEAFDEQPMPGLDSEAIDFRTASESFAAVRKLARRDLETLRLVTRHQGRKVPTVGGTDKSRIVDRAEIHALRENATVRQIGVLPASLRDGD